MDIVSNLSQNLFHSHGYIPWNESSLKDSSAFSALAALSKLTLVSDVGLTFSVLCIIDVNAGSAAGAALGAAADEIASVCPRNAFGKRTANLIIVEPEGAPPLPLEKIEARGVEIARIKINPVTGQATRIAGTMMLGSAFSKLLTKAAGTTPQSPSSTDQARPVLEIDGAKPTTVSWALGAFLCLTFLLSLGVGSHQWTNFTPQALIALGGVYHGLVFPSDGSIPEYGRLLTASLLHGDLLHLLFNLWALYLIGPTLERIIGGRWLFVLFTLSALSGSLASILSNEPNIVSVGASGAICGIMAAAYVMTSKLGNPRDRIRHQTFLAQALIPSLLPAASSGIDVAAHIGGAAGGALMALALLATWSPKRGVAPERLGLWGATICAVLYTFSLGQSATRFEGHKNAIDAAASENEALQEYSAALNQKDPAKAEEVIDRLLAQQPLSQEGRYRKAYLHWLKDDYLAAISILKPLYQETPSDRYVLYLYAESLSNIDRDEEAAPIFEKLLELDEDKPDYYYSDAAYSLFKLGRDDKAYQIAHAGRLLFPDNERLRFLRAISIQEPERFAEARDELQSLHSGSPDNTQYLYFLTRLALDMGNIALAKEYADQYAKNKREQEPDDDDSERLLKLIEEAEVQREDEAYMQAVADQNFTLAESIVKEAIGRRPNSDELTYRLAYLYRRTKRQEEAVPLLRALYVKEFGGRTVLLEFADALRATKAFNEAALVFNELLPTEDREEVGFYLAAAETFSALNDSKRVSAIVAEGLRHYPRNKRLQTLAEQHRLGS